MTKNTGKQLYGKSLFWIHSSKKWWILICDGSEKHWRKSSWRLSWKTSATTENESFCLPIKDKSETTKERTCWLFTEHHSDEWKKVECYWTRKFFFFAYEISKKVIHLFRHFQIVEREKNGEIQFWRIKNYFQSQYPQILFWSDDGWKACLAAGGRAKMKYQYCIDNSGLIVYLRAFQGHSGRNLIDPALQDNVVIQSGFFRHIFHIRCAFNHHAIMNNGLISGGQNSSKKQTIYFLPIDHRGKEDKDPENID